MVQNPVAVGRRFGPQKDLPNVDNEASYPIQLKYSEKSGVLCHSSEHHKPLRPYRVLHSPSTVLRQLLARDERRLVATTNVVRSIRPNGRGVLLYSTWLPWTGRAGIRGFLGLLHFLRFPNTPDFVIGAHDHSPLTSDNSSDQVMSGTEGDISPLIASHLVRVFNVTAGLNVLLEHENDSKHSVDSMRLLTNNSNEKWDCGNCMGSEPIPFNTELQHRIPRKSAQILEGRNTFLVHTDECSMRYSAECSTKSPAATQEFTEGGLCPVALMDEIITPLPDVLARWLLLEEKLITRQLEYIKYTSLVVHEVHEQLNVV
ncbi:hypothetical protein CLF_109078 [Clonorchis sinensis]|uniref:Uncharacterized protein n=1 Tax=Clonorchis sinensis TaxID=79923 RepID=G7YIX8_CLOSI|nr:hypothetical protein CLF_109078 [Clonorchis sinensis]